MRAIVDFAAQGLCNQDGLEEGSKVDEAFAWSRLPIHQPIGDRESCHQVQGTTSMIAGRLMEYVLGDEWAGCLFGLTRLDGGFLIGADDPDALS
jgi:hypothetical protein